MSTEPQQVSFTSPNQRLQYGQPIMLIDKRRRETYTVLQPEKVMNLNGNVIKHDDLVGLANGDRTESAKGNPFKVFKATLQQHILNMNRFATIIYPKDIASILMQGDIGPNLRVVEGGLGSGALAMSMLRAIGSQGQLTTYEINEAAVKCSTRNIKVFLGEVPHHIVKQKDIYEGIEEKDIDRVVLDVPEPWHVVPHAADSLADGGLLIAYIPTVIQVHELVKALRAHPAMYTTWSLEILERPWYVTEESIRPDHRMTGHTGFLVFSRRSARWAPEDGASKDSTKMEKTN
ncbi:MAG: tRNA (adenine-N1)-methyltransferase [Myxococcales bacterium]|nr:tRNA (adenine-N1)-methyltransferase [Myxococcales bacterium]